MQPVGVPLRRYVEGLPAPELRAVAETVFRTAYSVLYQASMMGMLHGDIRDDNMIVVTDCSGVVTTNDGVSRTRNFAVQTDAHFNIMGPMTEMVVACPPTTVDSKLRGIEDIRLYKDRDDTLRWIGASAEYSHDGHIRQVTGTYSLDGDVQSGRPRTCGPGVPAASAARRTDIREELDSAWRRGVYLQLGTLSDR
jgi:hypothetical protein